MKYNEKNGLKFLTFERFEQHVTHGIFTRHGGVSTTHAASLNVGGTVGDDPASVRENRRILFSTLDRPQHSMFDCWQVHGPDYVLANTPHYASTETDPREFRADSLLTNNPEVTLFMRFADCTPVLLFDPKKKVIGIAHAGWQGTVKKTASNLVKGFINIFGSEPSNIQAVIGPSIGPDHYEVGWEVTHQVELSYGTRSPELLTLLPNGKHIFNMWLANKIDLESVGVNDIEVSGVCTACNTQDWFSHRAEKGKTGRFGVLMGLKG